MSNIKLELKGFDGLKDKISPGKFERRLKKWVGVASSQIALIAEGAIKQRIAKGEFKKNKPMTSAIKGSSRPLVNSGELLKSIVGEKIDWDTVVVGVLKSRMVRDEMGRSEDVLNIAAVLHFGATIKVTEKMRRFFFAMADDPKVKGWKPLSPDTKHIVIPSRPFLKTAVRKKQVDRYKRRWQIAVNKALRGEN